MYICVCLCIYIYILCVCWYVCVHFQVLEAFHFSLNLDSCDHARGHKLYYVFGFLFIVFCILVITTVESAMLLCYFHLCAEASV